MGQAVSSNNPLDYKFDIPRPQFNRGELDALKSNELESLKNLRIYTDLDIDDQGFNFENIDCFDFEENAQGAGAYYYGKLVGGRRKGLGIQVFEEAKSGIRMAFGNFEDNLLEGYGLAIYHDNTYYHGQWKKGKCEGFGYYTSSFGDFYLGEWKGGEFITGIYRTSDFEYVGQLSQGNFHGIGRCYYFDGAIVQGNWSYDQLEGFANHQFPNKDNYVGYYKKSLKHGIGILYENSEQKIYEGEFFFDHFHGLGKEIDQDKKQFISAVFRQGKPYLLYSKQIYQGENQGDQEWILTDYDQNQQEVDRSLCVISDYNFEQNLSQGGDKYEQFNKDNQNLINEMNVILKKSEGYKKEHQILEKRLKQLTILHQLQKWHYEQNQDRFPHHFRSQYQKFLQQQQQQQ
ncbi:unnamed protein product (macronuclear) [Paramecium tetraurelia]|uniref:MORN repeat protein n=1 Tax=Paramecium tetraurelia TaxID=5888 RepID=A0EBJ7_PARTE|nr:uncharacterized protein GSPATT00025398001 [Paramecium tetraurelia]CAK92664.1 unnamed protein product [Paramecium tetraurelia]|eukprot:XP_001460061.1 hypothetical protein (macronuclear) [Paramecium tetraurelia strain d4-2]